MEGLDMLLFFRGLERLIISVGGLFALLFRWGVSGAASLKAQHDKTKLQLLNAAPGAFFALFGCAVLIWGLNRPFDYQLPASANPVNGPGGMQVTYANEQADIDRLLENLLRLDSSLAEGRLKTRLEAIQRQARALRESLRAAETR